mmetsp:Transcript_1252/g.3627  ORF Transcript_1252/g.3627 Transcript_1252/m.3627 type:complete len:222 (-) Transcript_1252:203-868(-)
MHAWTNATSFCAAAALVRPRYAAIGIFFAMTATNRRLMSSWPGKSRPCHVWQTVSHMCEYGPWPQSWSSAASWTQRTSASSMLSDGCASRRCRTTRPARCDVPMECSLRVCVADGKTNDEPPSCWMRSRRWNSAVSMAATNKPGVETAPYTRSWIVFVGRIGATGRAAQGRPERRLLPAGVLLSVCDIGPVHEPASSSSSLAAPGEAAADEKLCVIFGILA